MQGNERKAFETIFINMQYLKHLSTNITFYSNIFNINIIYILRPCNGDLRKCLNVPKHECKREIISATSLPTFYIPEIYF